MALLLLETSFPDQKKRTSRTASEFSLLPIELLFASSVPVHFLMIAVAWTLHVANSMGTCPQNPVGLISNTFLLKRTPSQFHITPRCRELTDEPAGCANNFLQSFQLQHRPLPCEARGRMCHSLCPVASPKLQCCSNPGCDCFLFFLFDARRTRERVRNSNTCQKCAASEVCRKCVRIISNSPNLLLHGPPSFQYGSIPFDDILGSSAPKSHLKL